MREREVIARLRRIATSPEARGLLDDVALLGRLVVTHDTIAEGVHFLSSDPAASVGWKLIAVNLSDLAAKGATPAGALLSLTTTSSGKWELNFLSGIEAACESYGLPLIGGDTIALPEGAPRVLGLTAIGRAGKKVPHRAGAKPGDALWLVGTVGDAAAGLAQLQVDRNAAGPLVDIYRRPVPLLSAGQALAPRANAMRDVSDSLLRDAERLAQASRCRVRIHLDALPLSGAFIEDRGQDLKARLFAATGGDDYALLAALPPKIDPSTLSLPEGTTIERIGSIEAGVPLVHLLNNGRPVPLPERLGFEHSHDERRRVPLPPMAGRH
jgi:thiamine-monophosphate kinase